MSQKPSAVVITTSDRGEVTHVFLNEREISHMVSEMTVHFDVNSLPSVTMKVRPETLVLVLGTAHIDVKSNGE